MYPIRATPWYCPINISRVDSGAGCAWSMNNVAPWCECCGKKEIADLAAENNEAIMWIIDGLFQHRAAVTRNVIMLHKQNS